MRFTILVILLSTALAAPAPQINFNDLLSELNSGSAAAGPGGQTSNNDNPLADLIANGPAFIGSLASQMFGTAIPIATAAPVAGAGNNAAVGGSANDNAVVTEVATFVTMTITVGQGAAPTGGPPVGSGNGSGNFGGATGGSGHGGNGGNGGNFGTAPSSPVPTTAAPSVPTTSAASTPASSAVSSAAETSSAAASTAASSSPSVGETAIPTRTFDSVATFVN